MTTNNVCTHNFIQKTLQLYGNLIGMGVGAGDTTHVRKFLAQILVKF